MTAPSTSQQILTKDSPEWTTLLEEYRTTVAMIQDSGRLIWVINGAFVVILGLLAKPMLDATGFDLMSLVFRWRAAAGLFLTLLWAASFERNYGFYVYRINYAKHLEQRLGLKLFTQGATLGEMGHVVLPNGEVSGMSWVGRWRSIQGLSRATIIIVAAAFGVAFAWSFCAV